MFNDTSKSVFTNGIKLKYITIGILSYKDYLHTRQCFPRFLAVPTNLIVSDPEKCRIIVNYIVFEANKIKFKPNLIVDTLIRPPVG